MLKRSNEAELQHRFHFAFEQRGQHDHGRRLRFAETGGDAHVVVRRVGQQHRALLDRALTDQTVAQLELRCGAAATIRRGVARDQLENGFAAILAREIEQRLVRVHQRHELRQDQVRHVANIALALQQCG